MFNWCIDTKNSACDSIKNRDFHYSFGKPELKEKAAQMAEKSSKIFHFMSAEIIRQRLKRCY